MDEKTMEELVEEHVQRGVARSEILAGLDRLERGLPLNDPSDFPKTSRGRILALNKAGCLRELDMLHENEIGPGGYIVRVARYHHATKMKKEAQRKWQVYLNAQPHLPKDTKPIGHWAIDIARWRAGEKVCEIESRSLHKRLRELEQAEEQERKRKAEALRWRGIGKIVDHKLVMMDGRAVGQNEQGEDVFNDDPSTTIATYLEEVKQRKRQKFADKKAVA